MSFQTCTNHDAIQWHAKRRVALSDDVVDVIVRNLEVVVEQNQLLRHHRLQLRVR